MTPLQTVVDALKANGCTKKGKDWQCPAHEDRNPSLSVTTGNDGKVLVSCHVGCSYESIVSALGLETKDLFPSNGSAPQPQPDRKWEIRDGTGELKATHHRKDTPKGKRIWWTSPSGEKSLGIKSSQLPLYGSERLADREAGDDSPVLIVEGEPAADALLSANYSALGTVTGASSCPCDVALAVVAGRDVVLWPDNDDAGRSHMLKVAGALQGVASRVRMFEPKGAIGDDAVDFKASHFSVFNNLLAIIDEHAKVPAEFAEPTFVKLHDGAYRFTIPKISTEFTADYLKRSAGQLKCELSVTCDIPGARTFDGTLSIGEFNLSSSRVRSTHGKYLSERANTANDLDWAGLLEEFAQRVLAAEKEGDPSVLLHEVERPPPSNHFNIAGIELLDRHPMIFFGDGGTAKSYLSLYIAGELARKGVNVGFFDWELAPEDHRVRLEKMFGDFMPNIHYVRCTRPLFHETQRLQRIVREKGIQYAIFDSIAFACDGPPESAECASRYYQALRQIGQLGTMHIAHITKSFEHSDYKPFGSIFWHNGARATWNVKLADASPDERRIRLGLYQRKANLGPKRGSVGIEFSFRADSTFVKNFDLFSDTELASNASASERIYALLKDGAKSREHLKTALSDLPDGTVRTALHRALHSSRIAEIRPGIFGFAQGEE